MYLQCFGKEDCVTNRKRIRILRAFSVLFVTVFTLAVVGCGGQEDGTYKWRLGFNTSEGSVSHTVDIADARRITVRSAA